MPDWFYIGGEQRALESAPWPQRAAGLRTRCRTASSHRWPIGSADGRTQPQGADKWASASGRLGRELVLVLGDTARSMERRAVHQEADAS
jgi:hypothetical protein